MTVTKRRLTVALPTPILTGTHPAADIWPMLSADELQALADDIAENGLIHPIVITAEGKVLDGRNRLVACQKAGVDPSFVQHVGDPVAYVLSVNARRRHMSKGAIAMAAWTSGCLEKKRPQREVAASTGAHAGDIGKAATVAQYAPELVADVIGGALPLDAAYTRARDRKDARDQAAEQRATIEEHWPDLAPAVDREEITATEAIRIGRKRDAEKAVVAKQNTERLARTVVALVGGLNGDTMRAEVAAECMANLTAVRGVELDYFTPDGIRQAADNLARFADAFEDAR